MIVHFVGLENLVEALKQECPEAVKWTKVFDTLQSVQTPVMAWFDR
jgi:hypothetical protein